MSGEIKRRDKISQTKGVKILKHLVFDVIFFVKRNIKKEVKESPIHNSLKQYLNQRDQTEEVISSDN